MRRTIGVSSLGRHLLSIVCLGVFGTGPLFAQELKLLGTFVSDDAGGHSGGVECVAFSPDGKTLATGGDDATIRLWDLVTGKSTVLFRGHTKGVTSLAFSPDGKTLASGSADMTARLWDIATGKEKAVLKGERASVVQVAFSPDGKTLAARRDEWEVVLWDVTSGKSTATIKGENDAAFMAFSPDGKSLATGGRFGNIELWDVSAGRVTVTLKARGGRLNAAAFSPNGKTLAAGTRGKTIEVWDLSSGKRTATLEGHTNEISSVLFHPDGKTLASASRLDGTIRLWDTATGKNSVTLQGMESWMCSLAFSPDGKTLARAWGQSVRMWAVPEGTEKAPLVVSREPPLSWVKTSLDGKTAAIVTGPVVRLWDVAAGKELARLEGLSGEIRFAEFSPDGKTLATKEDKARTIKIWDVATGKERATLQGHNGEVQFLAFHPNGKSLVSSALHEERKDFEVKRWDLTTGKATGTLNTKSFLVQPSPDGNTVAVPDPESIVLWDSVTGKEKVMPHQQKGFIIGMAFSPDGKKLASASEPLPFGGSDEGELKLCDLATGKNTTLRKLSTRWVSFSPDGKILASAGLDKGKSFLPEGEGGDCTIQLWDVSTGKEKARLKGYLPGPMREGKTFAWLWGDLGSATIFVPGAGVFGSDGKTFAWGDNEGIVHLWDVAAGKEKAPVNGGADSLGRAVFSSDGKTLILISAKTVRLWDVVAGKEIATMEAPSGKGESWATYSPDGKVLITQGGGEYKVWLVPLPERP